MKRWTILMFVLWCAPVVFGQARRPSSEAELRRWLENMVWHHRFSTEEISEATGMSVDEIQAAQDRWNIHASSRPPRDPEAPLLILPYPGGRHPRIGFLDGAVDPQRDTKFSAFLPWSSDSYVVVDLPEALWSNLGLTYLAHTHVPTVWTKANVALEPLEWTVRPDGGLENQRTLPNGIELGARVQPEKGVVRMELWLKNGTEQPLSDLRVQNCVMLKGAPEFSNQTNDNKVIESPYVCCNNHRATRWIITAWEPCHRPWANPPCPCLHSDPKFPDCPPGETVHARGILSFYEGMKLSAELKRLDELGWRD